MADKLLDNIQSRQTNAWNKQKKNMPDVANGRNFNVQLNRYPEDLGGDDLLHYVEFGIVMRGKSKFIEGKSKIAVTRDPNSANMSQDQLGTASNVGMIAGAAAGGAATQSALTGLFSKAVTSKIDTSGKPIAYQAGAFAAKNIGAVAAGGAAALLVMNPFSNLLAKDTAYRITDTIALHMDGPPVVKYGVKYANADLGSLAGALAGDAMGLFNGEYAAAGLLNIANIPAALGGTNVKNLVNAGKGITLNPFKEVIFEAVDFRTFQFKYKFMPKSKNESNQVKKIINLFKFHMYPEMSTNKMFFINPSEFQIAYRYQGADNPYLHRFAACVLTDMDITYGSEQFSSFSDGAPTEINMSLTFQEKETLTKEMIGANGEGGY